MNVSRVRARLSNHSLGLFHVYVVLCLCVHVHVHWCSAGCDQCSQVFISTVHHLLFECFRIGLRRDLSRWGKPEMYSFY